MISAKDYIGQAETLDVPPHKELEAEVMALGRLVSDFAMAMLRKLAVKCKEGKRGWDDPGQYAFIIDALQDAVDDSDWVSVANYAAMLWNIDGGEGAQDESEL